MVDPTEPTLRGDTWDRFRALPALAQLAIWVVAWPVPLAFLALRNPPSRYLGWWWTLVVVAGVAWIGSAVAVVGGDPASDTEVAVETTTTAAPGTSAVTPEDSGPTSVEPTTTRSRPPTTAAPDVEGDDGPGPSGESHGPSDDRVEPVELLASLRVEPEPPRTGYDRDRFSHWDDADGDGCDTRCEVLAAARRADGSWFSEWDGATAVDERDVHVDHVVALAEAWDSGASGWAPARRDAFADDPDNLVAVTAASNVRKSDRDAAEWFPSRPAANCRWASTVVAVKAKWDLAVDPAERDALGNLLRTCQGAPPPTTGGSRPPPPATTGTTGTSGPQGASPPAASPPGACDGSYPTVCIPSPPPDLDCGEITPRGFEVVGADPHRFDGDGDGVGCES